MISLGRSQPDPAIPRKYSDAHIAAILCGNFLRLLTSVWSEGK